MFITGVGRTKFGRLPEQLPELAYKAMYNAINDCAIGIKDIDAIYVSSFLYGPLNSQLHLNSLVASLIPGTHIPIVRVETACASSSAAFNQALYSLKKFNNIMIIGIEKMTSSPFGQIDALAMAADRMLDQMNGLIFPANYALIAQQYMKKYQVDHATLEEISYVNHKNANSNPLAHFYRKQVTKEMIKKSHVIASPLNLFDCSPISDGAAALVVSRQRQSDRDVTILSSQLATDCISLTQRSDLTSFRAAKFAAQQAYLEARLTPADIDLLEVHDCFTISELIALEDLGICHPGQASQLISDGYILKSGRLPVNIDGGLIGNGHPIGATGLAQIYEIVTQLRGEAEWRQVSSPTIGMAHNIGGIGGTAGITILGAV